MFYVATVTEVQNVVDIVMTTYNSEQFLKERLDSICRQTYQHWRLFISDDNSDDNSREIIYRFCRQFPGQIFDVSPAKPIRNVSLHVEHVVTYTSSPYVMFSDHDDVWFPEKVEISLQTIARLESIYGPGTPCLAHSDLQIVSHDLTLIHPSLWHYEGLKIEPTLTYLLFQNTVTGCATIVNRTLLNLALPMPSDVIMYDWWFALVACGLGSLKAIPKTTMLYRQHQHNLVGAKNLMTFLIKPSWWPKFFRQAAQRKVKTGLQAKAFYDRFKPLLKPPDLAGLEAYITLTLSPRFNALKYRQQLKTIGLSRGQLLVLLLL
jgi:hypothetical protein